MRLRATRLGAITSGIAAWLGLRLNGAALRDLAAAIALTSASTITGGRGGSYTLSGPISGAGGLTFAPDAGTTITRTNATGNAGPTVINSGTLRLSGGGTTDPAQPITINPGGVLAFGRNDTWGFENTASSPAVTINAGGVMRSDGAFNSLWNLTLNGGTVSLTGGVNSSYGTFILAGTLTATGTSAISVVSGANNQISIGGAGNLTLTVHTPSAGDTLTIGTALKNPTFGSGGLQKTGAGTLILTQPAIYGAATTVNAGSLIFNASGFAADTGINPGTSITVNSGATLKLTTSWQIKNSQPITINGGTLDNATNGLTYINNLTMAGGTIVTASDYLRVGFFANSTWNLSGVNTIGTVSLVKGTGTNHTFNVTSGTTTVAAVNDTGGFAGASLTKTGSGTLVISGAGNYIGSTIINGGTLRAGHISAFGTGTITVNAGGTLDRNGFAITNAIVNNGGTVI